MICNRCGVVNRMGRVACIHCMGPLDSAAASAGPLECADHPGVPATGQCVTCAKLVCDQCGGIVNNRAVYCVPHAEAAIYGAPQAAKPAKAPKPPKAPKQPKQPKAAA